MQPAQQQEQQQKDEQQEQRQQGQQQRLQQIIDDAWVAHSHWWLAVCEQDAAVEADVVRFIVGVDSTVQHRGPNQQHQQESLQVCVQQHQMVALSLGAVIQKRHRNVSLPARVVWTWTGGVDASLIGFILTLLNVGSDNFDALAAGGGFD
jgi:hypothetical protein